VTISEALRRDLAARCRSRRTRSTAFTPAAPTQWQPYTVRDPRSHTQEFFTEDGAWNFVADAIETGVAILLVELQHPPGKKGYVMLLEGSGSDQRIYVKLQLRSSDVLGRSFHISTVQGHGLT
jgi:hypothetical protein